MRGEGLHLQYPKEYSAWKNMKQRAKVRGDAVAPEFMEFSSFFRHVGPLPDPTYTLDQIDRRRKLYSPDNVQWADKRTQSANRSNTILVIYDGEAMPLAEVARRTDQSADTLRRRYQRGWSNEDIVRGRPIRPQRQSSVPPIIRQPREVVDNLAEMRWLEDEDEIHAWHALYFGEEETEFGSYPYNESGLSVLDFVFTQSEKAIALIRGGSPLGLIPPLRAILDQSENERSRWASRLEVASARAFQQMLRERFFYDGLVDRRDHDRSIEVTWHIAPLPSEPDYRARYTSMRKAISVFRRSGKTLPPTLAEFLSTMGDRRLM
ncbi:hypothetical protein [Rhizobium leguminosarum]|uniref:hypothetical protein n=1 Tax=Rhizobium leguminosarum TaxID=384 RepID=UPI00103E57C1|nr:hypothetical protein [Rhizobium leguminosarum]TBZ75223.1 hypothetical protein E0H43_11865 [Rhizobium leguminosarum bv. viciae]